MRRICLDQLEGVRTAAARLGDPDDAEALHDLRVALRRLRTQLRAAKPLLRRSIRRKHRRALDRLQHATNRSRDLEVALEWLADEFPTPNLCDPRVARLIRALGGEREDEAAAAHRAVRAFLRKRATRLEEKLARPHERPDLEAGLAYGAFLAERGDVFASHLRTRLEQSAPRLEPRALHRARIACKRLRYLYEPARRDLASGHEIVAQCKPLQDLLGGLHDVYVLSRELEERIERGRERAACAIVLSRLARQRARLVRELERDRAFARGVSLCALVSRENQRLRRSFRAPGALALFVR